MSSECLTDDAASTSYPLKSISHDLTRYVRPVVREGINLRSCELHHPKLTALLEECSRHAHDIQFYPFPVDAMERIASLAELPFSYLTLAAGSDALIGVIVDALVTTGRMILQAPNYFGWRHYADLRGIEIQAVPFGNKRPQEFSYDDLLSAILSSRPSMVVVSNPNSPTGFQFTEKQIVDLSESCKKNGHLFVIDECFSAFSGIDHFKLLGSQEHVVLVRSFSKSFGLAGARVALAIASPTITSVLHAYRTEGAVSGTALRYLEFLLSQKAELNEIWQDIIYARNRFVEEVEIICHPWRCLPSGGNYVNVDVGIDSPARLVNELGKRGFHIRDMSSQLGMANLVRFGIAHWPVMEELIEAIKSIRLIK